MLAASNSAWRHLGQLLQSCLHLIVQEGLVFYRALEWNTVDVFVNAAWSLLYDDYGLSLKYN